MLLLTLGSHCSRISDVPLTGLYSLAMAATVTGGGGVTTHRVTSTALKAGLRYPPWGDFYLRMEQHRSWGGICGQLGQIGFLVVTYQCSRPRETGRTGVK